MRHSAVMQMYILCCVVPTKDMPSDDDPFKPGSVQELDFTKLFRKPTQVQAAVAIPSRGKAHGLGCGRGRGNGRGNGTVRARGRAKAMIKARAAGKPRAVKAKAKPGAAMGKRPLDECNAGDKSSSNSSNSSSSSSSTEGSD